MNQQTVKQLKVLAKNKGIPKYYRMRKAEQIEALALPTPPPPPITNMNILDQPVCLRIIFSF